MTLQQLREKVRIWDLQYSGTTEPSKYGMILQQLDYHATREWQGYLPAEHTDFSSNYMERLAAWIGNVTSDNEQKLLLEYALFISFFSHADFAALYRTAMNREILRWVAAQIGARLEPHGAAACSNLVQNEIDLHTWFCPVTDSMDINEFCKINHVQGVAHRPGFAAQQMLARTNPQLVQDLRGYMANPSSDPGNPACRRPPLRRLVLLEDIVGSATQCIDAIRWAVANLGVPVLFVPLILCPNGVQALRNEERTSGGRLAVRPIIELHRSDLLGPERQGQQGWPITNDLEAFVIRHRGRLPANIDVFGYRSTGCSIATFANTPDNTIPIVHHKPRAGTWTPLFPRVYRD